MSKLISTRPGAPGGGHEGKTIFDTLHYQQGVIAVLKECGARWIPHPGKRGLFSIDTGKAADIARVLEDAAALDLARSLKERVAVPAAIAATVEIGDDFDFGPGVGVKKVTSKGKVFRPKKALPHDPRIADLLLQDLVYLGNAGTPANSAKKALSPDEVEARRAASAAKARATREALRASMSPADHEAQRLRQEQALAERDASRISVLAGSVAEGDPLLAGDATRTVSKLGRSWTLDDAGAKDLARRFPDVTGLVAGATVQYANWLPEAEPAEVPAP
ncbi:hypothetical protein LAZ40_04210 [Cereibacter sphaeroides]|uniref:hypothetical protein n=1 Tax=Cereibacter sphaeroides TaxID=1063 RepID=UPI001F35734B|nr:hypothetical protein [Cereibacter sphaeroides]MCE6958258.1 hypothetical protein [Cereibacter sphaeroides]MCE6971197.1 hypothetical protein [Cereibacter sphaeroides]